MEHFNDKRRYFKKSLAGRRAEIIKMSSEFIDWTPEELDQLLAEEWHDTPDSAGVTEWVIEEKEDLMDKEWHELDEYDKLLYDSLPETLGEESNG